MQEAAAVEPRRAAPNEAVEAYLAAIPEPAQTPLRQLRALVRSAVPEGATEVISYGIPAFAFPKPFSGSLFAAFAKELRPYTRTKSSLHLPFDEPLPAILIRKLVHARLAMMPSNR